MPEYDYKTMETREDRGRREYAVFGWKPYRKGSMLEGQMSKNYLGTYPTVEEALEEHPGSEMGHPAFDPVIGLHHLPDEGDL